MMSTPHEDIASDFQVFVTAAEAWPALERAVLGSKVSFFAGFRIFDLCTKLRSREALDIGATWFDLLEHALRRGVQVSIVVSDFDPVMAVKLHELAWRTVRQGAALAETAEVGADQLRIAA
ncbi:MAG: phosphatidylserine synthase, partial [Pseudomonadota bacterium]